MIALACIILGGFAAGFWGAIAGLFVGLLIEGMLS